MRRRRIYRGLLRLYPAAFREEYGSQMELAFAGQGEPWGQAFRDLFTVAPREHWHVILQDLRYAVRSLAVRRGFTAVALGSLALGIGANTAIFSVWYSIALAPLPLVREPQELVMLTNPEAIGQWHGDQDGERSWLTYPEFEWMRDHLEGVSGLMATQSSMDEWRVRIQGGGWEQVRGHFVSGGYFDLLRVNPAMGRVFTQEEDHRDSANAVISYGYWQRRFGGRPDVIGQSVSFRQMPVTVIGVMPRGFVGEVAAQQPDMWIPARMQPRLSLRENLLQDGPTDGGVPMKRMWLHAFGRLKPGVTVAQIQSRVDALFRSEMERSYGKVVDQHLVVHEASRGVSDARREFSASLAGMLGGAGILLLIACANLANLLLARGAARRSEFAIRIAQGASRSRLVRQLVTESLVLTTIGAVMGIGLAYALHRALVAGLIQSDSDIGLDFDLNAVTLAFTVGVTLVATFLCGVMPAWRVTNVDAQESLSAHNRSATASVRRMRFGRALVALQLALALPLLAAAGMLMRTIQNSANVDLGYKHQGLLQIRVDAGEVDYKVAQENALRERLLREIQRIPGVQSVIYSDNGLFSGGRSIHALKVDGYTSTGGEDSASRLDVVATGFFTTLGVRPLKGRVFVETDTAKAPLVMVINETFAKKFLAGRDPLGVRVVTGRGEGQQILHIVGVIPNIGTQNDNLPRSAVPQYYVPAEQRTAGERLGLMFVLRASTDSAPVFAAVRQILQREDASLLMTMRTVKEALEQLTAYERTVGTLAAAFGAAALLLAAIGLYGVLSYGVARRRGEIGIRMALGADRGRVVLMILGESVLLVIGGAVAGFGPAMAVSRLVQSEFPEFAPEDPAMLLAATVALLVVAFAAAYFPARRASRLDPMVALRPSNPEF